ncbi:LysR family transcriptional regulator [Phaeacidiphilus oryzae]|uniref:LysR family transcriptional regulator n=1 Tax=Phaeacidiphilus oryzae TaxID=348818 RepID=UPI00068DD597|nr:LysR family transcriptional regulator [Phaeacidiphilus oryzae]
MVDLDTRELEYFVAVAEELHFGRAATRLAIAQPALSKAIRRVESRLGVQLLLRTSRQVSLTPAGEALLHHGRHALNAVAAAAQAARRAGEAESEPQLRLVIKPGGDGNLLSAILAEYGRTPDARRVDVIFGGATDRADRVRDGRADLALLYAPFDDLTGLDHETLHVERRVAVLPPDHPLAARGELHLADLAGETLPRWKGVPGTDDSGRGPVVADVPQLLQLVILRRLVAVLPDSLLQPRHPDLAYRPVIDAPPSRLVLAWSQNDRRPLLAAFVDAAVAAAAASVGADVPVG